IAIFLSRIHLENIVRHLTVVTRPECPAARWSFAGRAQIPIKWRRENLPAYLHLAGLRIDFDAADHSVEFLLVIIGIGYASLWQRHGKSRGTKNVLAVLRDERRAVVADGVRNRPKNLVGFEIP